MRIGILSDPHLSFSRYSKVNDKGVNVREADFYRAFLDGVENLMNADVEAIVDLGDLADVPHPKKRTLHLLIDAINGTGLPWYSVNGNHTLVRHSTDTHLYDLLEHYCKRFIGIQRPYWVGPLGAVFVPYGTSDEIKRGLELAERENPDWIGGHWAANDVLPDGADINLRDLPTDVPLMLGHFHGRSYRGDTLRSDIVFAEAKHPVYVGATERKAWGEDQNLTGVATYDTQSRHLHFIDHEARDWIDITAEPSTSADVLTETLRDRDDQPIVRLTIPATREEYRNVDELALHRIAHNTLDFTVRRRPTEEDAVVIEEAPNFSLSDDWRSQVAEASISKSVTREEVERVGIDALTAVGVAA